MVAQQRPQRGGHDIGATAHRFGENDIRPVVEQAAGGLYQVRETATETASGDLLAIQALNGGVVSVHQVISLVVEDGGHTLPALLQQSRRGEDQGSLSGSQEAADHREYGFQRATSLPSRMVALGVDFFPFTSALLTASAPWSTARIAPAAVTRNVPHPVAVLQKQRNPGAA